MRQLLHKTIFLAHSIFAVELALAETDRLLKEEAIKSLIVTFKQDGRAIEVFVENNSQFVITSTEIACFKRDTSDYSACRSTLGIDFQKLTEEVAGKSTKKVPNNASKNQGTHSNLDQKNCYTRLPEVATSHTEKLRILPGKSASIYIEQSIRQAVDSCSIKEARGRERRVLEF